MYQVNSSSPKVRNYSSIAGVVTTEFLSWLLHPLCRAHYTPFVVGSVQVVSITHLAR